MAVSGAAFDLTKPLKRGNLLKQGAFHKAFKHREFVLYPGFLVYYDSEKSWRNDLAKGDELRSRIGAVKLRGATISPAKSAPKHCKYGLTIEAPDPDNKRSQYLINTSSKEERDAWIDALRKATPGSRNLVRKTTALKAALSLSNHLRTGDREEEALGGSSAEEETNIDDVLAVVNEAYPASSGDESYFDSQPLSANGESQRRFKGVSSVAGEARNFDKSVEVHSNLAHVDSDPDDHSRAIYGDDADTLEPAPEVQIWVGGENSTEYYREMSKSEVPSTRKGSLEKYRRHSSKGASASSLSTRNSGSIPRWKLPGLNEAKSLPPSFLMKTREDSAGEAFESSGVEGDDDSQDEYVPIADLSPSPTLLNMSRVTGEPHTAILSYMADESNQLSFEADETLYVIEKNVNGWWFVSNGREEGWVPCTYLDGDKDEEDNSNSEEDTEVVVEKYYALDDYTAEDDDEVSLQRDEVVDVLKKSVDGWWRVKVNDLVGLAPSTYLKVFEEPKEKSPPATTKKRRRPPPIPSNTTFQQPPRRASVRAKAKQQLQNGSSDDHNKPENVMYQESQRSPVLQDQPSDLTNWDLQLPSVHREHLAPILESGPESSPSPIPPEPLSTQEDQPASDSKIDQQSRLTLAQLEDQHPERAASPRPRKRTSGSSKSMDEIIPTSAHSPDVSLQLESVVNLSQPANDLQDVSRTPGVESLDELTEHELHRPVPKPRTRSSQGSLLLRASPSADEESETDENTPPISQKSDRHFERVKRGTHETLLMDEPLRPASRPRNSEIKKAKQRARSHNRQGRDPGSDERSSSLTADLIRRTDLRTGSPGSKDNIKERSRSSDRLEERSKTKLAPPGRNGRFRSQSPVRQMDNTSMPSTPPPSPSKMTPPGVQDADIANTLLRYFMSSEDPAVKSVLQNIIQDSTVHTANLS